MSLDQTEFNIQYSQMLNQIQLFRCAKAGAEEMANFKPDVIIALGGGSAMDAAKIMWVMYEHPEVNFQDLAMTFMDIRKRIYKFPTMGQKAMMVCNSNFSWYRIRSYSIRSNH